MTQASSNEKITLNEKKQGFFTKAMLHNGIQNIKSGKGLMIVFFLLHFAALPMLLINLMCKIVAEGEKDVEIYTVIGVFCTGVAVIGGMVAAFDAFSYLYKKTNVDMRMSLPMTTLQRFVSDFLSGLFVYVVPFLAAQVFTFILTLAGHIAFDGKTITMKNQFNDDGSPMTWVCDLFGEAYPYIWRLILGGLVIMIMFYALTVLITSCCGSLFECIGYNLIANVVAPFMCLIAIQAFIAPNQGLDPEYYLYNVISYSSPVGGVVGLFSAISGLEYDIKYGESVVPTLISFGKWFVIFTIETLAVIIGAYLVYRKRKAEDTGKPVVFGVFYHIIMTLAVACISFTFLAFGLDGGNDFSMDYALPMVIVTAIVYFVFAIIRNRGVSHLLKSVAIYTVTMGVCIGSYFLVSSTSAFGIGRYVPDVSAVDRVYISYQGFFSDGYAYDFGITHYNSDDVPVACFSDPAEIEIVTQAHELAVDKTVRDAETDYYFSGDYAQHKIFRVLYVMKSGRTVVRQYDMPVDTLYKLGELDMTETLRAQRAKFAADEIRRMPSYIEDRKRNNHDYNVEGESVNIYPQWYYYADEYERRAFDPGENSYLMYSEVPADFCEKLADCYYNDIYNETEEQYYTPDGKVWKMNVFGFSFDLKENYTETIAYLRECGITDFPVMGENGASALARSQSNALAMVSHEFSEYIAGRDYMCCTETPPRSNNGVIQAGFSYERGDGTTADINIIFLSQYAIVNDYSDELAIVLDHCYETYKTDESCYTIYVGGDNAVIPAEYNAIAEKLYIRSVADTVYDNNYEIMTGYDGDEHNMAEHSYFMRKFIEFYGEEKIYPVLEECYGDAADAMFGRMTDLAQAVR